MKNKRVSVAIILPFVFIASRFCNVLSFSFPLHHNVPSLDSSPNSAPRWLMVWLLMFPLIEGITHRGIILSILIFIISLSLSSLSIFILSLPKSPDSSQPFPYSNTHFRSSRPCPVHAIVEMSSATFACILTGRDGADARYLPNSAIHQLSVGRSEQERGWGNEKR